MNPAPQTMYLEITKEYNEIVLHDNGAIAVRNLVIAFGYNNMLRFLKEGLFLADGKFDSVSAVFFQLYTLYAKVGNAYIMVNL